MLNTWCECLEASSDSVSESQWNDVVPATDDETSEAWTQPWDLPARVNYADYSNINDSRGGLRHMSSEGTASKNIQTEHLSAKGTVVLFCVVCVYKIVILYSQWKCL